MCDGAASIGSRPIRRLQARRGMVEAGQHLNLLPSGIEALKVIYQGPAIKLSELIGASTRDTRELING